MNVMDLKLSEAKRVFEEEKNQQMVDTINHIGRLLGEVDLKRKIDKESRISIRLLAEFYNKGTWSARKGDIVALPTSEALQLLRDFPKNWELITPDKAVPTRPATAKVEEKAKVEEPPAGKKEPDQAPPPIEAKADTGFASDVAAKEEKPSDKQGPSEAEASARKKREVLKR